MHDGSKMSLFDVASGQKSSQTAICAALLGLKGQEDSATTNCMCSDKVTGLLAETVDLEYSRSNACYLRVRCFQSYYRSFYEPQIHYGGE